MTHLLVIILFAMCVAVVFGGVGQDTPREQIKYGIKVFAKFVLFAVALAWVLFFVP